MDRILKSFLDDFMKKFELTSIDLATDYENFCNYTLITKEYNDEFNLDDVATEKNQGIDGIAIIVNGHLITNESEIEDLLEVNKYLDVVFVMIQTKSSEKFESSEIGNFFFTVKDFFSESPALPRSPQVDNFLRITQKIFTNYPRMTKGKPTCKLYYVTTGRWIDDQALNAVITANTKELEDTALFESVSFEPVDSNQIQKYYRKTSEKVSAEFTFEKSLTLPPIAGVKEAYLGLLPFSEFRNLLIGENDRIKNIFYDNVRDWLGENPVNKKINETLQNKNFDLFTVLNNGITVVAEEKSNTGNLFTITNYQIVNGCQTSHILFKNRQIDGIGIVNIPIRLIITEDENVKNKITLATNRQTEITEEQLAAFSEFQKNLEQYYKSILGLGSLFYERRTGQYNTEKNVTKTRIVTIRNQIKVFASMFLNKPDLVSGYYGKVYKKVEGTIFKEDHKYIPYYTSGYAAYILETQFRTKSIDSKYKKARYHILMLFRMYVNNDSVPPFNSKKMEDYCQKIIDVLNSDKVIVAFKFVTDVIDKSGIDINNQKVLYQKNTTDLLISTFNQEIQKSERVK